MNAVAFSYQVSHWLSAASVALATGFLAFRLEAALLDASYWLGALYKRLRRKHRASALTVERLGAKPEQRIALFVPCWHESIVVDRMVETALSIIQYTNYEIFVGCYPNDDPTLFKVRELERKHPRVHAVVNDRPGPTTKAQNLNCVYRYMKQMEGCGNPFTIVVLHDVEDVIHPLSFGIYNWLLPRKDMVQIPVLPLERPWWKFVAWTYADEFCEHHLKDMVVREGIGAFVPSAGVGTAFSRAGLEALEAAEEVFAEKALTEDYQSGLRLHVLKRSTIFVQQRLGTTSLRAGAVETYVATRAYFPDTIKAAVRQKSRWIAGICLQSWQVMGWQGTCATRYALMRDRRTVLANLLVFAGFINLGLIGLMYLWHAFAPLTFVPVIGDNAVVWMLLDTVLLLTLAQLFQTALLIAWAYGPVAGLCSLLRPPIAGLINGLATIRALWMFAKSLAGQEMRWAKTAHIFPGQSIVEAVSGQAQV